MNDLISRQAAIDAVMNTEPVFDGGGKTYQATADVISALTNLPSAQPERKWGKWEAAGRGYDGKAYRMCSNCGASQYLGARMEYCPNCGAYMRGGDDA